MAEKEERKGELRIRINQFLWPTCKECGSKCKDEKEIKFCRDSQPGMTRQEAIERIAHTWCESERHYAICHGDMSKCNSVRKNCAYWADAEEVLEVLLEEK